MLAKCDCIRLDRVRRIEERQRTLTMDYNDNVLDHDV